MSEIYRVTSATIGKTKNGYTIFKLQLDNSMWVTKLAPIRSVDKARDPLFKIYEEGNEKINSIVGKYTDIVLNRSSYGMEFNSGSSYDIVGDFKKLLDEYEGKSFYTSIPVYNFLKQKKYKINIDHSITLKKPFEHLNIILKDFKTVCYPNEMKAGVLTLDNIHKIYSHFYDKKIIDTGDLDHNCCYKLTPISIIKYCERYHKTKSKTLSSGNTVVLALGENLHEEHLNFLSNEI